MDSNEIPHDPGHLANPSGASKTISDPMVHSTQTMHLSSTNTNTVTKIIRNEIPQDQHHLRDALCASNNDIRAYGMIETKRAPILR
jgi:hypothetical protein